MVKEALSEELVNRLRNITTLDGGIPIYKNAKIQFKEFHPNDVLPIANYVLVNNLILLTDLRRYLLDCENEDIFNLHRLLDRENILIAPPVIEWSSIDQCPVIVDGIHRLWLAKHFNQKINCIFIDRVDPNFPVISYPISWDDVSVREIRPDITRKMREGVVNSRLYYRDLSPLGSLGRRQTSL